MKVSIRVKIVALGAIISALTMAVSLFVSDYLFRMNSQNELLDNVYLWLDSLEDDYLNHEYSETYRARVEDTYNYVNDIYKTGVEDPEEFESFDAKKQYFKNRYKWVYTIDGIGMYWQSEEERTFRANYDDLSETLRNAAVGKNAASVYLVYFDDTNNQMIFLADDSSYIANYKFEYHLPGSHVTVTNRPQKEEKHYSFNYNGLMTKCIPIGTPANSDDTIAYIMIEYNFDAIDAEARTIFLLELLTLSLTYIVLLVMFFILSHFMVTRNVIKLSKSSQKFTDSLKSKKELVVEDPHIKSRDEIRDLSNSFVALENEIINYVDIITKEAQEKEKFNAELSIASKIQLDSLPNSNYADKNLNLKAFIKTAKEVGGDFYDYFYLNDNQLLITICDVSGKGVPAALFMMKGKELIKSFIKTDSSLPDAIYKANNELVKNNYENLFITAFVAIIDFAKHEIKYVNAGHEKPYLLTNGEVEKLDGISNFVLGGESGFPYVEEKHSFNPGDRIFLFTDGLNEAINSKEEEFSYSRIEEVLKDNINSSINEIIENMNIAHNKFVAGEDVFDDVTMLLIEASKNELHLSYQNEDVTIIEQIVDQFEKTFAGLSAKVKSEVGIIIDEIVNNIISYSEVENLELDIDFKLEKNELVIIFKDNGKKFDPLQKEDKYLEEYSDDIETGGFGIGLVKTLSTSQKYEYKNKRNILMIRKDI